MFVDTHAHLCFPDFAEDLPATIERARAAGVGRIISIATDLASAEQTLAIARRYPAVDAAVGLHPGSVPQTASPADLKELGRLASDAAVVAVGETGLDYYREARHDPTLRQTQKELFRAHLELARDLSLPVVIHQRAAEADLLEIVRAHAATVPAAARPWGVLHCYAGDETFARACLACGLLISLTGILTFKSAADLRAVAATIPLEQLMLETDAPYLAPVPHRGQRNEPAYLPHIAGVLAEAKRLPLTEIAQTTSATAEAFFRPRAS